MRVCLASPNCQARIEQQDATISPGCEETALVWRGLVVGIIDLEGFVDVLERGWGRCRWADGEAEAVGLIRAVVGVLACDDDFDGVERRVSRPVWRFSLCISKWERVVGLTRSIHPSSVGIQFCHSSALA